MDGLPIMFAVCVICATMWKHGPTCGARLTRCVLIGTSCHTCVRVNARSHRTVRRGFLGAPARGSPTLGPQPTLGTPPHPLDPTPPLGPQIVLRRIGMSSRGGVSHFDQRSRCCVILSHAPEFAHCLYGASPLGACDQNFPASVPPSFPHSNDGCVT